MRRKICMGLVFVAIVGGGWFALAPVRSMIAAGGKPKRRPAVAQPAAAIDIPAPSGTEVAKGQVELAPGVAPAGMFKPGGLGPGTNSYGTVLGYAVELTGPRAATIRATAVVGDRRKTAIYAWGVKVKDNDNKTLQTVIYKDKAFDVDAVGEMEATFADTIAVPAGVNWIQLKLYAFPRTLDPSAFEAASDDGSYEMLSLSRQVTAF